MEDMRQGDQATGKKGQWKRRARMQTNVNMEGERGRVQRRTMGENKKREAENRLDDPAILSELHPEKKGRLEVNGGLLQHSEVGNTSREWSQPYK